MLMLSLPLIVSTFGIIFIAELPDKTAFASLVLAARYRARDVIVGAWAALFLQTLIAVAAGSVIALLPARPVHIAAALGFLAFAYFAVFKSESEEQEMSEESRDVAAEAKKNRPAWLASFAVIFIAEWGDLTQFATATLAARVHDPLSVGIGAMLALWSVSALAVLVGAQLARLIHPRAITLISGALFAVIGIAMLASAF